MALSDIVNINISTEVARVERQGFGMPLVLAADAPVGFTERVRFYTDMTGATVDFPSGATHDTLEVIFEQDPKIPQVAVGRLANKPTQRWAITPVAANSTTYAMLVNGNLISITSDGSATVTEIIAALKTAIDALSLGITVSDQTTFMRIVATAAGASYQIEVLNTQLLGCAQDQADPGYSADLDAILVEDSSWYLILNPFNSKAIVLVIAAWAEANGKLFLAATQDSAVINVAAGSDDPTTGSVAAVAKGSAYFRTALIYHPANGAYADGGWAGVCLPLDPGSETWAMKTLAGVNVTKLTSTQHTNAINKFCNTYETYAGINVTGIGNQTLGGMGRVSGNEFIDVIRFRDWLEANMQADVFAAKAKAKKIPFTDGGISVIEGILLADLKAGEAVGGLVPGSSVVIVPTAASISPSDKAARKLTGITFDAELAGAIQATSANGSVSI